MSLHLVREEPPKPRRKKYTRTPVLSDEEARRFRQALKNLQGAFGSYSCLAKAMGVVMHTVWCAAQGRHGISGDLIVKAMRASGLGLKDLIGEPVGLTRCPACGAARRAS